GNPGLWCLFLCGSLGPFGGVRGCPPGQPRPQASPCPRPRAAERKPSVRPGRGGQAHNSKVRVLDRVYDLDEIKERLEQSPEPDRPPERLAPGPVGSPTGPTQEEIEALVYDMVPEQRKRDPNHYDPHRDDPVTKGFTIMSKPGKVLERVVCCRGCGVPIQTHDSGNVGYVPLTVYLELYNEKLHRKMLCSRCSDTLKGVQLQPVVKEVIGDWALGAEAAVPAELLEQQLYAIRQRRCLVVFIIDVLDFNGAFIRNIRRMVGVNPIFVVATKVDLLPKRTDLEKVEAWLRHALLKRGLKRVVDVQLVSNQTGKNVGNTVGEILKARQGNDVVMVGSANAGKSFFVQNMLDHLEARYPNGKVDEVTRPLVSSMPGTTLGIIPLRAFRKSVTSRVYSSLYDTPGVHQALSMQSLVPITEYSLVQPTRQYSVRTFRPASDVIAALRDSGEQVTAENTEAWLGRPVRYVWGAPGRPPVAAIEVPAPVPPMLQLSFVGVENLTITCQANVQSEGAASPEPPEGLSMCHQCFVQTPERLQKDPWANQYTQRLEHRRDVFVWWCGAVGVLLMPIGAGRRTPSSPTPWRRSWLFLAPVSSRWNPRSVGRTVACSRVKQRSGLLLLPLLLSFLLPPASFLLPSSFLLPPSSFLLPPSSFLLRPSSFLLPPSSSSFLLLILLLLLLFLLLLLLLLPLLYLFLLLPLRRPLPPSPSSPAVKTPSKKTLATWAAGPSGSHPGPTRGGG
ncbi:unnamed protein product, partial [Prorocentrum cordatum]